jgi:CP family cyanate transporter-like MFS transporter
MAVTGALTLVGAAGVARSIAPDAGLLLAATLLIGVGIGLGGTTVPVFVKQRFAGQPAAATGTHVTGIILGSVVIALSAVPMAHAFGSWRWPLALSAATTLVAAAGWSVLTARMPVPRADRVATRDSTERGTDAPARRPHRSRVAWLLVTLFCLQSLLFFGLSTWLPAAYVERGWSESSAAGLVAVLIASGLPASIGIGWLADRVGSRRTYLVGSALVTLVCCLGFVYLPDAGLLWAALVGMPLGALFALALTLPLDASARPADVGPLIGLMLGVGYLFAAAMPVVMGAARDVAGTFTASLGLLAVGAAILAGVSLLVTESRLAAARTDSSAGRPSATGAESAPTGWESAGVYAAVQSVGGQVDTRDANESAPRSEA